MEFNISFNKRFSDKTLFLKGFFMLQKIGGGEQNGRKSIA